MFISWKCRSHVKSYKCYICWISAPITKLTLNYENVKKKKKKLHIASHTMNQTVLTTEPPCCLMYL